MNVKTDTKEKFTVITPIESELSVIMTEELSQTLVLYLQKDIPHVILNLQHVATLSNAAAEKLAGLQQKFYENNCSFVICSIQPAIEEQLDKHEILELLNATPTESEAWDIVQMEEIERELLSDEEDLK